MPLIEATLAAKLRANFEQPGKNFGEAARQWADAVRDYAAPIVPPSTTVAAAADALAAALVTAFGTPSVPGMEAAFGAFAVAVGGGMAGFTPVPPPGPVGFAALFTGPYPETSAAAAQIVAARIHAWLATGTATLVAPPNTLTPWS